MGTTFAKPFTNIAISLSGGGYRATAFHLGALSYLNDVDFDGTKLLKNVSTISTISGGTLTGVMVALYLAKGDSFENAYYKLYQLLTKDDLFRDAFDKVNNINNWDNSTKTKNLINAISEVYNQDFYDNETYQTLLDSQKSHLKDIIFGATEFSFGEQFRFQNNGDFGNFYLELPEHIAGNIRLGDIAASSSCFPGGFEPMKMPMDYANSKDDALVQHWNEKYKKAGSDNYSPTAIMDGGIIDNQGIEGIQLAEERRAKEKAKTQKSEEKSVPYTGTYIVSDVSAKNISPYQTVKFSRNKWAELITFKFVNIIVGLLTIGIICSLIFFDDIPKWATVLSSVFLTIFSLWLILFLIVKNKAMATLKHMIGKKHAPKLFKDFNTFFNMPIYVLVYLIKVRIYSLIEIVNNIFMRRIRQEQMRGLFDDGNWRYRVKYNNIYTLQDRTHGLDIGQQAEFELSSKLKNVVKLSNEMPTTLWFSTKDIKEKMLDNLIACGQFTLCRNLIRYIEKIEAPYNKELWDSLTNPEQEAIRQLDTKLRTDFVHFNENPFWLIAKIKAEKDKHRA